MGNKKIWAAGYALLCILYFAVSVAWPHDKLESRGLSGIGKPTLREKTEELTDGTELRFSFTSDEQPLSQLSFYFTAGDAIFTEGTVRIAAYAAGTDELLAQSEYELADLGAEAFWGVEFEEEPEGQALEFVITCEGVTEGPSVWLNTETETAGVSYEDGAELARNLIYNAVYRTQVHYVKKPLLVTGMLALLGVLGFCLAGKRGAAAGAAGESAPGNTLADAARENGGASTAPADDGARGRRQHFARLRGFCRKHRQLLGLGVLLGIVALVFFYVYDVQIRKAMNSTHREVAMKDNNELLPVSADAQDFVQYYTTEEETLVGLGVRLDLSEDFAGVGTITAEVRDVTEDLEGTLLCTAQVDASTLLDGQYMGLIFDESQTDTEGHIYEIALHFSDELLDSGLSVILTPAGYYAENPLYINGEESDQRLSMNAHTYFNLFLKRYFFAMFLFTEAFAAVFYALVFVKRARVEKVFLFTILCLGVLYNFLLTPYMTPDESYHIDMAYRHSNTLLGIDSAGENQCWKRKADTEIEFTSEPSLENYKLIYDGLLTTVDDDTLVEAEATSTTEAPLILYLPAVLGMTLARLLHLGTVPMLLLGRYCSLAFFGVLAYFAMKKLPFGKMTLFLLAILPMNLQQCTSFSYDAVINGVIFLYICWCIALAAGEKPVKLTDALGLGLLSIVMVYGKSGVYLPLAGLVLLIPRRNFGDRRTWAICTAGLLLLPLLAFLNKNTVAVNYIATTTEATATVGSSTTAGYTLGYFLAQPLELVRILANTLADKTSFYLESLVGQKMGWVEIEISEVIPLLFWLLLIASALTLRGETVGLRPAQKGWIACVCAACIGIILAGMLLTWTPKDYVSIEGVQGRYFIPFMPALLLLLRNRRLTWERDPARGLMYAGFLGQLLTVMYLIKAVLVL